LLPDTRLARALQQAEAEVEKNRDFEPSDIISRMHRRTHTTPVPNGGRFKGSRSATPHCSRCWHLLDDHTLENRCTICPCKF